MASGLLSLKWNNHKSTFFHVLSSIRSKESYCDATLACDGRFYPVHKLVLSTCSEYFEQIFEKTQCKHPVIVLKDIKFDDLDALLNYMYIGEVNVLQDKLAGLIKAAECLKIKGLAVPDEDPLILNRENKRSHRGDAASPHSKKRRREFSNSEREKSDSSHTARGSRLRTLDGDDKTTSPDSQVDGDHRFFESEVDHSLTHEASHTKGSSKKKDTHKEQFILGTSQKIVPEVYLDDMGIKSEPPDIEEAEEVTESKETLQSELGYEAAAIDESLGDGEVEGDTSTEEFVESSGLNLQNLDEDTSQAIASSSSNFQGDSFHSWEGDGSLQSFPEDSFAGENSQGRSNINDPHFSLDSNFNNTRVNSSKSCSRGFSSEDPKDEFSIDKFKHYAALNSLLMLPSKNFKSFSNSSRQEGSPNCQTICEICNKECYSPSALMIHKRTHTGDKPFFCRLCPYRTTQRGNLNRHMRVHTGEEPFQCSICPATFKNSTALKVHVIMKHNLQRN